MDTLTCRLCGNKDLFHYYTIPVNPPLNYFKCRHCKLINYEHSQGLDQDWYEDEYINPKDENAKMNKKRTQTYLYIKKHLRLPGRMLEVGCSNARILYLARKDGWKVKGIELFESTAQLIKEEVGIDIEVANFLEYQVDPSDKFNIVILRHVLEHLPDPIHAMNQINTLLKDDGYTLLEFPNVDGFKPKLKRWMDKKGLRKKKIPADAKPAGHYHEFSRQSIELLLSKTGFVLHDYHTYTRSPIANLVYHRIHIGNKIRVLARKLSAI